MKVHYVNHCNHAVYVRVSHYCEDGFREDYETLEQFDYKTFEVETTPGKVCIPYIKTWHNKVLITFFIDGLEV